MGIDDVLKQQIRERAPELKQRLVQEFEGLTHEDLRETSDEPDEMVDKIHQKTGQRREQVEDRVKQVAQR